MALERSGVAAGSLSPSELLAPQADIAGTAKRLRAVAAVRSAVLGTGAAWRRDGRVRATAGLRVQVGEMQAATENFVHAVYGSFQLMIAAVELVTFLLLAWALRSILLPLMVIALNVVSVGAAWGVMALVGQHGYGSQTLFWYPGDGHDHRVGVVDDVRVPVRTVHGP